MPDENSFNNTPPSDKENYVAWIKRMLKIALDGGPNVVSARALATQYAGLDDKDSQAQAAIRDTKRGMFASGELNRVAELLDQAGIRAEDEEQRIGLARWVVYSRLATAIALIYSHNPEQDWVQAAILTSIDSTPVREELKEKQKEWGRTIWDGLFQILGDVVLELLMAKIARSFRPRVRTKSIWLALLRGIRTLLRGAAKIGPVSPCSAIRDARKCRKVGKTAQRIFRFRGLPSTTEKH